MSLRVDNPGPLMLVQDLGRPGLGSLGVPASGALDRPALEAANLLVGNDRADAALEILLGGARVTALAPLWLAITGAAGSALAGGHPAPLNAAFRLEAGESLDLAPAEYGLRYYLGVRGGIDVPGVLGSRSTDTLSGLGPAAVAPGDVLAVGEATRQVLLSEGLPLPVPARGEVDLRVTPGPRLDWFAPGAWAALGSGPWTVSADSNRVGVRLEGTPLERSRNDELPSEGMVTGSLQVPPSGLPILFLADHPTTGGYPVIGVVAETDLPLAAQVRPGQSLRFLPRGR
ncbi:MAG: allophanate hydrolase [Microbacteriaceae bacterium]|nr:allophanate hydrolase [Microbacteriaceae bacterium]